MTPRQRLVAVLEGRRPDRIATDYWATSEFDAALKAHLGCEDDESLCERLHIDQPLTIGPRPLRTGHRDDPQADQWAVRFRKIDYGTGTYNEAAHNPLAGATSVQQVHDFAWPCPDDYDYSAVTDAIEQSDGRRAIRAGGYEPFLIYCKMRGLEQSYEDLILYPDIAGAILGHLFDFHYEQNRRIYEAGQGRIDLTYVAEDLGAQNGPLISLEHYRRFLRDHQQQMADLARSYRIHVFYHTDGAARMFLPDLIDVVGIEVLNPIQWRCPGMEREALVRDFGGRVAFHGAMDNQHTLPFGSVDDVIAEVKENIEIFANARWICAPCHNIQAITPPQNIVAMYEAIHEFGKL